MKQQIYKKIDYSEIKLSEFINFINDVMQVFDLKAFFQACQNVCIIKSKSSSETVGGVSKINLNEESKEKS